MKARVLLSGAVGVALLGAGCVHPLGPGFRFVDRGTDIRAVPHVPGEVHVRVADRLENIGNVTLHTLEVRLPDARAQRAQDLRVTIDGKDATPEAAPGAARLFVLTFQPTWKQMESRRIVTQWDIAPQPVAPDAAAQGMAFYVADPTILPFWHTPPGFSASGDSRPPHETLTVVAPDDFRVYAPGRMLRPRREGQDQVYTFKISAADPWPFVVAGRYQERTVRVAKSAVVFWTFAPLDAQQAQAAANRLAEADRGFSDYFGPGPSPLRAIRVAEAPGELSTSGAGPAGESFPGGMLLDSRALAQGIDSEAVLDLCEYELARSWFGWQVLPRADAQTLLGRGVAWFGVVVAAEASDAAQGHGENDRRKAVTLLLDRFDEAQRAAADQPLLGPAARYNDAQRLSTGYKAALFFVALEDLCGRDKLSAALREIMSARAGMDVTEDDLRAALEDAAGRNLAETFHEWEDQRGIPQAFRERYAAAAGAAQVR